MSDIRDLQFEHALQIFHEKSIAEKKYDVRKLTKLAKAYPELFADEPLKQTFSNAYQLVAKLIESRSIDTK